MRAPQPPPSILGCAAGLVPPCLHGPAGTRHPGRRRRPARNLPLPAVLYAGGWARRPRASVLPCMFFPAPARVTMAHSLEVPPCSWLHTAPAPGPLHLVQPQLLSFFCGADGGQVCPLPQATRAQPGCAERRGAQASPAASAARPARSARGLRLPPALWACAGRRAGLLCCRPRRM